MAPVVDRGIAAAPGHPFGLPRDQVGERTGVPPERNAAAPAALGDAGAYTHVRPRTGQVDVPKCMWESKSPPNKQIQPTCLLDDRETIRELV